MKLQYPIILFLVIILSACGGDDDDSSTTPTPSSANTSIEEEVLKLVNRHRASVGLDPLVSNETIVAEARGHSENMAKGKSTFSHDGYDERIDKIHDAIGGGASGENIAKGQKTAQAALDSWLASDGHRKNIEGDFHLTGIGVAQKEDEPLHFTQIFLKK